MKYSLFKYTRRGKTVWYYHYTDSQGVRHKKSTGHSVKWKAEQYVDQLRAKDERNQGVPLFREFASAFFGDGCPYLRYKKLKPSTIDKHRRWLDNYLLPRFGDHLLSDIKPHSVEQWLDTLVYSATKDGPQEPLKNSSKSELLGTLRIILTEAHRNDLIQAIPLFRNPIRSVDASRKDIFTDEELKILFPESIPSLIEVWKPEKAKEPERVSLMLGVLFAVSVSAGLRNGEARALRRENLLLEQGGLTVTGQLDMEGKLVDPKKATQENRKHRAVPLPERTMKLLQYWLDYDKPDEWLFTLNDEPTRREWLQRRLKRTIQKQRALVIKNAPDSQVFSPERNLTSHSFRYTYNTKMESMLPGATVRLLMGHDQESMTSHYSNPQLSQRLRELKMQGVSFW
jgi:integrase